MSEVKSRWRGRSSSGFFWWTAKKIFSVFDILGPNWVLEQTFEKLEADNSFKSLLDKLFKISHCKIEEKF